jgi:hypothetical protein
MIISCEIDSNSNPMYEPSRWQKNILIGKGNQAKGTFLSSKKHLEHFGRTASTKSIFQGTQLFSKKFSFQENFYRKLIVY